MASAEERLKEREREVRRRREKEEREMDEQRSKVRLEEAVAHFEALLSERVKHHDVRPIFNLNFYIYLNISI
jgi:transcription elongation regulator 1